MTGTPIAYEKYDMIRHPAKFTNTLLPIMARLLLNSQNVLDPFAGTGKLCEIQKLGYNGKIYLNELEREWLEPRLTEATCTFVDAEHLPYDDNYFDAICTSPTYGNRMADHHNAKDASLRNTYTHCLGRKLDAENTGTLPFGAGYREKHNKIWRECSRVLKSGALFILNVKDHIRDGKVVPVTEWHIDCLKTYHFELTDRIQVPVNGNRFGANSTLRVDYESIIVFRKKTEGE